MKTPTQQQLNDPAWWDENAPEWAKTIIDSGCGDGMYWFEHCVGVGRAKSLNDGHVRSADTVPPHNWTIFASRPTKPQAPEWDGDGWPPAGVVCEAFCEAVDSRRCEVIAHDDKNICVRWWEFNGGRLAVLAKSGWQFRPIRTKEQREREELANILGGIVQMRNTFGEMADAIIAAGWRKSES